MMEDQDEELEKFLYDGSANDLDNLELDKYMTEPLLKYSGPFDNLLWWRGKTKEYPILTQIARDVMAIQVLTVAFESAFSAGSRVIDPYRSSISSEMVEALICTKDWIAAERKDSKKVSSMMSDLELMEAFAALMKHEDMETEDGVEEGVSATPSGHDGNDMDDM